LTGDRDHLRARSREAFGITSLLVGVGATPWLRRYVNLAGRIDPLAAPSTGTVAMYQSLDSLKRLATPVGKILTLSHTQSLDWIATKYDFPTWALLHKAVGNGSSILSHPRASQCSFIQVLRVMTEHTDISTHGLASFDPKLAPDWYTGRWRQDGLDTTEKLSEAKSFRRAEMLSAENVKAFERCCKWLSWTTRTRTINQKIGTYRLKHKVERYWQRFFPEEDYYVPEGMFTAAAFHLGFEVRRVPRNTNANINISMRHLPYDPRYPDKMGRIPEKSPRSALILPRYNEPHAEH
jgi:hypothetical protein